MKKQMYASGGGTLKNRKGFTLIELLAVIVILAIIALIATPIVLNIISDSRESATLQSAQFYMDAVENAVAQKIIDDQAFRPETCDIQADGNLLCEGKEVVVEIKGEKPTSGTITLKQGKITGVTLVLSEKTITKNNEGKLVYQDGPVFEKGKLSSVCKIAEDSTITGTNAGAKYTCEVKEGTSYTFYVLNSTSTEVNLIMDQNINSDGSPVGKTGTTKNGENVYNLVAWNVSGFGLNNDGPVTAMNFLYNATKDWTNIDPLNYTYNDKTTQGTTAENTSYTSFVSSDGIATITPLTGDGVTIGSEATPLRARMPIYANDASITEVSNKTDANAYLYADLDSPATAPPYGYWTLSSDAGSFYNAWVVSCSGKVYNAGVDDDIDYGVRPVINLKI